MKTFARLICGIVIMAGIVSSTAATAAVWYIDVDNTAGPWNGTSWATAFNTIQAGVDAAFNDSGGEVWVAEGTYTDATNPVVTMKTGVDMYGGFSGTETNRSERDWISHVTTIDGGYYRCLLGANDATVSGFTITNGVAEIGGGMLNDAASPIIEDCIFQANYAVDFDSSFWGGGAIACVNSASPNFVRCTFASNSADCLGWWGTDGLGGALYFSGGSPSLNDCIFTSNYARGSDDFSNGFPGGDGLGGAIYSDGASLSLTNCIFRSNVAQGSRGGDNWGGEGYDAPGGAGGDGLGGALYFKGVSPTLTNCTFTSNLTQAGAGGYGDCGYWYWDEYWEQWLWMWYSCDGPDGVSSGGGIYNASVSPTATNCILWGDTPNEIGGASAVVTYSCVQGGYSGTGNIATNPSFVNAGTGNLRLNTGSPCINTGTSNGAPSADIVGVPRPQGLGFDMGAYEYVFPPIIITQQPLSQTVPQGQPVTFTVGVSGGIGPISYQWRRDGMPLTGGSQSAYMIASAQMEHQGSYTCLVTDDFNAEFVESDPAILTVLAGMPVGGGLGLAAAVLAAGVLGVRGLRRLVRKE